MSPLRVLVKVITVMSVAVVAGAISGQPMHSAASTPGPAVAQFNLCGGHDCAGSDADKVGWLTDTVLTRRVDVLTLNEVCEGQLTLLLSQLADRGHPMHAQFVSTLPAPNGRCTKSAYGNAVLTTAAPLQTRRLTFVAQQAGARERRAALCVLVQLRQRVDVCTAHLSPGKLQTAVRDRQVAETRSFASSFSGAVLVMGDLNDYPAADTLDRLYAPQYGGQAYGSYVEGGSLKHGSPCRCGQPTRGTSKLDYVFAKMSHFGAGTSETIASPYSDHDLLLARPDWI